MLERFTFQPVEKVSEGGLELNLEESLRSRFVGLVEDRFAQAERAREHDERSLVTGLPQLPWLVYQRQRT